MLVAFVLSLQIFMGSMASSHKYRLMYFGFKGRAAPFGQIPILFVDDKPLAQSKAIYRYLAVNFGFAGADPWESAQIDQLGDHLEDFRNQIRSFISITNGGMQGDKEKFYSESVVPARDVFLPPIEKFLERNAAGFLIGSKVSWADLMLAELMDVFATYKADFLANFPKISAHREKIQEIPAIKAWIEKRPKTLA